MSKTSPIGYLEPKSIYVRISQITSNASGGRSPKAKGYKFESDIVKVLQSNEIKATRSWGSNGKALGLPENVDILIHETNAHIQCKRSASLPDYLYRNTPPFLLNSKYLVLSEEQFIKLQKNQLTLDSELTSISRKTFAANLLPASNITAQAVRADRKPTLYILHYENPIQTPS